MIFAGIDVQTQRKCTCAFIDESGEVIKKIWFSSPDQLIEILSKLSIGDDITFGIDSPRMPLVHKRKYYWNGSKGTWRKVNDKDKGVGRHCEVIVSAYKLANPQWTPLSDSKERRIPEWMLLGFELFKVLEKRYKVYEVFPTASLSLLRFEEGQNVSFNFTDFVIDKNGSIAASAKDMLDAIIAAYTVFRHNGKFGEEVGGGDGLGTILLPVKLNKADRNKNLFDYGVGVKDDK